MSEAGELHRERKAEASVLWTRGRWHHISAGHLRNGGPIRQVNRRAALGPGTR